jgi:hypothetical protein
VKSSHFEDGNGHRGGNLERGYKDGRLVDAALESCPY